MRNKIKVLVAVLLIGGLLFAANTDFRSKKQDENQKKGAQNKPEMMQHMQSMPDHRTSLNLAPHQARHQLMNMRGHLKAVQTILAHLSRNEFDEAAAVASSKLGLTDEMQMMCSSFGNEEFETLGLEFHKSADRMSEIFKTKDLNKSLEALSATLNYCNTCHATFKQ